MWREFLWGAIAGAFGEGMMHPVDTVKTRMQSQAIFSGSKVCVLNSLLMGACTVSVLMRFCSLNRIVLVVAFRITTVHYKWFEPFGPPMVWLVNEFSFHFHFLY